MTDLLAEVDDLVRRERAEKLWREHRLKIVALILSVIVITAVWSFYTGWDERVKMRDTANLLSLTEKPGFPQSVKPDALDMRPDAKAIAMLLTARAYLDKGEKDAALALYKQLADSRADSELRQLGMLMQVRLQAGVGKTDAKTLQDRLQSIASDTNSPWRHHARLESAALYADAGDYARAHEILAPVLKEDNLPESFSARAASLDHLYALRMTDKK